MAPLLQSKLAPVRSRNNEPGRPHTMDTLRCAIPTRAPHAPLHTRKETGRWQLSHPLQMQNVVARESRSACVSPSHAVEAVATWMQQRTRDCESAHAPYVSRYHSQSRVCGSSVIRQYITALELEANYRLLVRGCSALGGTSQCLAWAWARTHRLIDGTVGCNVKSRDTRHLFRALLD
jgi:hypothetical protein